MVGIILRAFLVVAPLLTACASSGLYDMSDEWCAKHLDASAARCPKNQNAATAMRPAEESNTAMR